MPKKTNYDGKKFSSTSSELMTLAPVLLRCFKYVVDVRGRLNEHVASMVCLLTCICMLLSIKQCAVDPDDLKKAVEDHFVAFLAAYGPDFVLPKHHFALHLHNMLRIFGVLLTTMVTERKHRLVKQYCRPRCNKGNFNLNALEDVTVHQLWEMKLPFFNSYTTSEPKGRAFHALRELWPGVPDDCFTLHRDLKLNGGNAGIDDVVSFAFEGQTRVGQLKLAVGIKYGDHAALYALITLWESQGKSADGTLETFTMGDVCTKVLAEAMDTVFVHRIVGSTCSIILPYERQHRP